MPVDKTPFKVGDRVRILDEHRRNGDYEWSPRLLREDGWYVVDIVYPEYQLSLDEIRENGQYQVVSDNRDRTRVWVHHIELAPPDDPNVRRNHDDSVLAVVSEGTWTPPTFTFDRFTVDDPFEDEEQF